MQMYNGQPAVGRLDRNSFLVTIEEVFYWKPSYVLWYPGATVFDVMTNEFWILRDLPQ